MNQRLVDAANRLLPIFVKHALWRPKARAVIGRLMYERDIQRLEEDLQEGVKLAESLGLDVSDVELPSPQWRARLMDGKALAERIRGEIAEEVRELGEIGPRDGPRRRRPRVGHLHPAQAQGRRRGRDQREGHPARLADDRGGVARAGRGAQRRRRDRRPPRPAPAAGPHRRGPRDPRDRPGEGHRRAAPAQLRPARARRPTHVGARRPGSWRCSRSTTCRWKAPAPSSSGGATSSASRRRSSCCTRTPPSPSATRARGISRGHARGRDPGRRRRPSRRRRPGRRARGRDGDRRRHEPARGRRRRRRRSGGRRSRGAVDSRCREASAR